MRNERSASVLLMMLAIFMGPTNVHGLSWPILDGRTIAPITSPFGARCLLTGDYHAGMDIRTLSCNKVVAVDAGTVYRVASYSGYDWSIVLRHGTDQNYWYSGYHHFSKDSILVSNVVGTVVKSGQVIALAGPINHLHFNYWRATPADVDIDANTSHPLRYLGANGEFSIQVSCACYPYSAIAIRHYGQLLEAGAGLGYAPYSYPFWTYVWNYEGNVRTYTETFGYYEPGDCYLGASAAIGVSPTTFEVLQATTTHFVFPASQGVWILNNSTYTYALSTDGTRITIERPINDFFQDVMATVKGNEVIIEWTVSASGSLTDEFAILKSISRESLEYSHISVLQTDDRSYQAIDTEISAGKTYFYGIEYNGDAGTFSAETIEIAIPCAKNQIAIASPWPNPFRENACSICFVPDKEQFDISVYDVSGRLVRSVMSGSASGDEFTAVWDGTNNQGQRVSEGCYFLRLYVRGYPPLTEKVFLLK